MQYNNTNFDLVKQELVDFIFANVNLGNYKYKILRDVSDLKMLLTSKFYVSANYSGTNSLLVFCMSQGKYLSYMVDRRTLKFDRTNIVISDVKAYRVFLKLDASIYNGTIFDGTFITNGNKKTFVITDAYMFKGHIVQNNIIDKLQDIISYLSENYIETAHGNSMSITVNKLYEVNKLDELINKIIPASHATNLIKGVSFYSEKSGDHLIYIFYNSENDSQTIIPNTNYKEEMQDIDKDIAIIPKRKQGQVHAIHEIRRTEKPDVYKLFLLETVNNNGTNEFRSKPSGIAYIPDMKSSELCRKMFINNNNRRIFARCIFVPEYTKWQPVEHCPNEKCPTNYKDIA